MYNYTLARSCQMYFKFNLEGKEMTLRCFIKAVGVGFLIYAGGGLIILLLLLVLAAFDLMDVRNVMESNPLIKALSFSLFVVSGVTVFIAWSVFFYSKLQSS